MWPTGCSGRCVFCVLLITITRSWRVLGAAFRNRTVILPLIIAAVLIAVNWLTYVYGVTTGQAVEASLGYFINPLVSVLLGVVVLKEKLRPLQWAAVGIGFIAVGVLTVSYGKLPWIALTLALSFGLYGFVKKRVGPRADALTSLTVETIVLAPVAAAVMASLRSPAPRRWQPTAPRTSGSSRRPASSPPCRCCSSAPPPGGCR